MGGAAARAWCVRECFAAGGKKEYMVDDTSYIYYSYIAQSYHMSISRSSLALLTREDGKTYATFMGDGVQ